ncbi:hypothetical protein [Nostoc commune]|nr:hypothetical protein [Nostoc commune]
MYSYVYDRGNVARWHWAFGIRYSALGIGHCGYALLIFFGITLFS